MVERIGYPEFILDDDELDNMYKGVSRMFELFYKYR